jgi:hypothetical protein
MGRKKKNKVKPTCIDILEMEGVESIYFKETMGDPEPASDPVPEPIFWFELKLKIKTK